MGLARRKWSSGEVPGFSFRRAAEGEDNEALARRGEVGVCVLDAPIAGQPESFVAHGVTRIVPLRFVSFWIFVSGARLSRLP